MEASFWRRLWTCRQTEYWMNEWIYIYIYIYIYISALVGVWNSRDIVIYLLPLWALMACYRLTFTFIMKRRSETYTVSFTFVRFLSKFEGVKIQSKSVRQFSNCYKWMQFTTTPRYFADFLWWPSQTPSLPAWYRLNLWHCVITFVFTSQDGRIQLTLLGTCTLQPCFQQPRKLDRWALRSRGLSKPRAWLLRDHARGITDPCHAPLRHVSRRPGGGNSLIVSNVI